MGNITEELLKTIDYAIHKRTEKFNTLDLVALVTEVNGQYCTVKINSATYKVKNGTNINFNIGDTCLIHCINYNFNNKVIIAKL